jgi:hypothetical protein
MNRRGILTGLGSLFVAAPAIVRFSSIMPVKAVEILTHGFGEDIGFHYDTAELIAITRKRLPLPLMRWMLEDPYCPDGAVYIMRTDLSGEAS